jgi:hypothetical protein
VSLYFAQADPIRWTAHMSECLRLLEHNSEFPSDKIFALQVRLQLLTQRATQIKWRETDAFTYENEMALHNTPSFYLDILLSQLSEIKRDMSSLPAQDMSLNLFMHSTESAIYDMIWSEEPIPNNTLGLQRLDCMSRSLLSIKSWVDVFLTLANSDAGGTAFVMHAQFARCIVTLFRISKFVDPLWNLDLVRESINILTVFDRVTAKLDVVSAHLGEASDEDYLRRTGRMLTMMKSWCAARLPSANEAAKKGPELPNDVSFDFYNEAWMEDVFGENIF